MCECKFIQENKLTDYQSYYADKQSYEFTHVVNGKEVKLLYDFEFEGLVNYAAISEVKNCFGIKSGYIIVIGEQ